ERHDLGPSEIAPEQLAGDRSIRFRGLTDEHGRKLQMRPARADDLQLRLFPIDELPAPGAPDHRRFGAELIETHAVCLSSCAPRRTTHQINSTNVIATPAMVVTNSQSVR